MPYDDDDTTKQDSARDILGAAMASFTFHNDAMADDLRLSTLARIRIMDSEPEPEFDDIISLAAAICDAPIASMAFLDDKRSWIKAKVGIDVVEVPVERTLCAITVASTECVIIEDSHLDERAKANPWVNGEEGSIRFYAGVPLVMPNGAAVGSLCVAAEAPRILTALQRDSLEKLSRITVSLLAKRPTQK